MTGGVWLVQNLAIDCVIPFAPGVLRGIRWGNFGIRRNTFVTG